MTFVQAGLGLVVAFMLVVSLSGYRRVAGWVGIVATFMFIPLTCFQPQSGPSPSGSTMSFGEMGQAVFVAILFILSVVLIRSRTSQGADAAVGGTFAAPPAAACFRCGRGPVA